MANTEKVRLNKYLSQAGICSRREADVLIEEGKVSVNGKIADQGMRVNDLDKITVEDKPVGHREKKVVLAYYKPVGVTCTEKDRHAQITIRDVVEYPVRVTYAGRLDRDSEGLLLLTNDGDLINGLMRAANFHEKEYLVRVNKPISRDFLKKMSDGMLLKDLNERTRPCFVKEEGKFVFRIILTQGLNRQIRRMCKTLGYGVLSIKRVRVANILLGKLNPGDIRAVTGAELKELYYEVGKNASRPARPAWEKERQPAAKKEAQTGAAEPRVNGRIANAGMQRSGQNPAHRKAGGYAKTADRRQGADGAHKAEQRGTYRSTADSRTNGTYRSTADSRTNGTYRSTADSRTNSTYRSTTDSRTNGTYRNGSGSGQTGVQKKRYE